MAAVAMDWHSTAVEEVDAVHHISDESVPADAGLYHQNDYQSDLQPTQLAGCLRLRNVDAHVVGMVHLAETESHACLKKR